ncbi:MAG: NHL repeat-containing protein [Ignavibacteriales bacterium]|nr:MAG: NHL repeat-containing protein [Ignavibacteriales bacterium]
MKTFFLLFNIVLLPATILSQQFKFAGEIGSFKDASSFYINSSGHIYVTDSGKDEIYKLDTTGTVLKFAGGFGWDNGSFDDPVDIFATSLTVYVCDRNNHRIQRFDKDLNFISSLSTRENENSNEQFGYPISCVTSAQGDMFILDSENNRIIKFDMFGNFIQNFGGFDYGDFALSKPVSMAVSPSNTLFFVDGNSIVLYDQFGNGISRVGTELQFKNIRINFFGVTMNTGEQIYYSTLSSKELKLMEIQLSETKSGFKIISSIIFNDKLYVLTPTRILIYEK